MQPFLKFRSKPARRRHTHLISPWHAALERLEDRCLLAAPTVANPLQDRQAFIRTPFTLSVPANTFNDSDADPISLTATGMPAWLTFTPGAAGSGTGTFSGTPGTADVGTTNITVTATANGETVTDIFAIVVPVNSEPSFTIAADPAAVVEDVSPQPITVPNFATAISAGLNESGQTVTFEFVSVSNMNLLVGDRVVISSAGTLSYSLEPNANGSALVTVRLTDNGGTTDGGDNVSPNVSFLITVTAVNDTPTFSLDGNPPTVSENAGLQTVSDFAMDISVGPSDESTQTPSFAVMAGAMTGDLTFSTPPSIDSNGTLTYQPTANTSGTATFDVTLFDGMATTLAQSFTITVESNNEPPTVANPIANQTTPLGESFEFVVPSNTFTDPEGDAITLTASGVPAGLTFIPGDAFANPTGMFTGTPTTVGLFNVTVTATTGVESVRDTFIITVLPNTVPSFSRGANQTVLEDVGAKTVLNWATNISAGLNEPSQVAGLSFIVSTDHPELFSAGPAISADGTLTYTPSENANGSATVTVRLRDTGGTANGGMDASADQTFTIAITSVNDAPRFDLPGSPDQTVFEDATTQSVANFATAISAGTNDSGQTVDFQVSNNHSSLFSVQPAIAANGTLTYTPAANANGTATVTVVIHDNGGMTNGGDDTGNTETFTITINGINDAPSFTKGPDQTVLEDAGTRIVTNWATNISAGTNDVGQVVDFQVSNNNSSLFLVQPSISPTGTLIFTPAADQNGTATVTVLIHDDGGTDNGGVEVSAAQTFTITVTSVNDAPSFTVAPELTLLVNSAAQTFANFVKDISAGPNEAQTVDFIVSNENQGIFTAQPAIAANGTLTFTPAAGAHGSATVSVRIHDNGGIANGGVDTSLVQTFTIRIATTANGAALSDPKPVYKTPAGAKLRAVTIEGLLVVQVNGVTQRFYDPSTIETLTILGGSKNDEIDLSGLDAAEYSNADFQVVIKSGAGNDRIVGSFANDSIDAGAGNDTLTGGDGNDTLIGNAGTDRLVEWADANLTLDDTSLSGLGLDRLVTIETATLTSGDSGNEFDASTFTRGAVTLLGGAGSDRLIGGSRNDLILGHDGGDELDGGLGNDTLLGGFGDDELNGDAGNDLLIGGFDIDTIDGGTGRDTVAGGQGGAARGGDGVRDDGDVIMNSEVISEVFKKLFAFE